MDALTKQEANVLIYALEEYIRKGKFNYLSAIEIEVLVNKLKAIYTVLARVESGLYRNNTCPICGNELPPQEK